MDEMYHAAESARLVMYVCAVGAPANTVLAVLHDGDLVLTRIAAGLVGVGFVSWVRSRRYWARAQWLASTPRWWERLEEAPTLIAFPRLVWWLRRVTRTDRSGRHRLR